MDKHASGVLPKTNLAAPMAVAIANESSSEGSVDPVVSVKFFEHLHSQRMNTATNNVHQTSHNDTTLELAARDPSTQHFAITETLR